MMRRLVLSLVLLLAACSKAGSKAGDAEELADRWAETVAGKIEECCGSCEPLSIIYPDETCFEAHRKMFLQRYREGTDPWFPNTDDPLTFHEDCYWARLQAIEDLSCDFFEPEVGWWETQACPVFTNPYGYDCFGPYYGMLACPDQHTFVPGALGEGCLNLEGQLLCQPGLACSGLGICVEGLALGESCPQQYMFTETKTDFRNCDPGLGYCNTDGESPGICVPFVPDGQPCTEHAQCRRNCTGLDENGMGEGICQIAEPLVCDAPKFGSF